MLVLVWVCGILCLGCAFFIFVFFTLLFFLHKEEGGTWEDRDELFERRIRETGQIFPEDFEEADFF